MVNKKLLLILLLSFFLISNVYALTDYVDLNEDGAVQNWNRGAPPDGGNYLLISDGIRQPTSTGFDYKYMESAGENTAMEFGFTTFTATSVTSVVIWMYHYDGGEDISTGVQIYMGSAWQTQQNVAKRAEGWDSVTFNGTWTQTDLDNLQVRFKQVLSTGYIDLEEAYGVVTYTTGAPATNKFLQNAVLNNGYIGQ